MSKTRYYDERGDLACAEGLDKLTDETGELLRPLFVKWVKADMAPRDFGDMLNHEFMML